MTSKDLFTLSYNECDGTTCSVRVFNYNIITARKRSLSVPRGGGEGLPLVPGGWKTPPLVDTPLGRHPLADTPTGQTPPDRRPHQADTHPWADTPHQADTPLTDTPPGRHTPWADTHRADTSLDRHPPAQCMLGYGQRAGSTHPTAMHSCFSITVVYHGDFPLNGSFTLPETDWNTDTDSNSCPVQK